MLKDFEVVQFRYLSTDDKYDLKYEAWSRCYEYKFVLDFLNNTNFHKLFSIHNTSCGGGLIHNQFAKDLRDTTTGLVLNSDNASRTLENKPENFMDIDITKPNLPKFDLTLCISTLEHLHPDQWIPTLENLMNASNYYVVVTMDCPPVNLHDFADYLGHNPYFPPRILTPQNSVYKHPTRDGINIVVLVLKRKI